VEPDAKPNRAALESLPIAERIQVLADYLQTIIPRIGAADGSAAAMDAPWSDPGRTYDLLHPTLLHDLQFPLYSYDVRHCTGVLELAQHLARELEPAAAPAAPVGDPYDGGSWQWGSIPCADLPARNRKAVFLLSAPRSGSTLLRVMLARHPKLFAPPELHLLPFHSMRGRAQLIQKLGYGWMRRGLHSALVELEGLTPTAAERRVAAMEASDLPVLDVYGQLQQLAADRTLVDKTPSYACHPGWLQHAERLFEGARYIHLVRHPSAATESFVRMRFHRLLGRHWLVWDENPWRYGEKFWTAANMHIANFLKQLQPGRHITLLYEDLVANPARSLARICEFLELPFEPAVLSPYGGSVHTRFDYRGHGPALGDINFLEHRGIDSSLGGRWATARLPQRLGEVTSALAATFGYLIASP
jgi:hypothetical protein